MKKLTILIDMDDTIENLCEVWVKLLNEKHGTSVNVEDIKEWDMRKAFPTIDSKSLYEPLFTERLWNEVEPLPGAVDAVKQLSDTHDVVIVTASHPRTVRLKLENCLFKYFPFLTYNDVIIASRKQLVKGDILVDDAPHNHEGGEYISLLMDTPHNRGFDAEAHSMIRVQGWGHALAVIKEIGETSTF